MLGSILQSPATPPVNTSVRGSFLSPKAIHFIFILSFSLMIVNNIYGDAEPSILSLKNPN
jgi:hypothetical protein